MGHFREMQPSSQTGPLPPPHCAFLNWFLSYSLIRAKCEGKPHRHLPCPPSREKSALRRSGGGWRLTIQQTLRTSHKVLISQLWSTCHAFLSHKLTTTPVVIPENKTSVQAHPAHPTVPTTNTSESVPKARLGRQA